MDWNTYLDEMNRHLSELGKATPATTKGFGTLTRAAKENGVLDLKAKEFVALGISIAMRCEPCIGFHVKALHKAGGTREELADVLAISIQMGGGPSLMYAAKTLSAWDQLVGEAG
ncbi:carboxymuconolactone decarboxylase family protein [Tropicimonas sp. IMCC6043]|uniref:carboxymuconolactone decarboxylase family protein n=1 Tax=Tropicimonas sp. IMCC6043 TaxID=2510645 RepID=UPI00101DC0DC|nr:carboxymuconolactone decarboxylase family protein [Tropicimonas sp. IMCC6043]RYH08511.1 carboxymuconolactone decarboxylase family protein [Tropicimonas sp. IMCC6043]